MSRRVGKKDVEELLGRNLDTSIDLTRPLRSATALVARMITCATAKDYTHTSEELNLIEGWLACYFYCAIDPLYTSKSTGGASGSFQRGKNNPYAQNAMDLDGSGCLAALLSGQRASATWLGKTETEQIDYIDRN